jgi:D-alanyl-D-alanine carboxypeptidase (penicillin-binding protein 5/6)
MTRIRRARTRRQPLHVLGAGVSAFLLAATVLATGAPAGAAPVDAAAPPATEAPKSYLVVDGETGAVVAANNEHAPQLTASTIKVLTALVTLEHLAVGAPIHVSRLAASQPAMKIGMTEGSTWPIDQALASLLIVSANDAAYALAENAGGTLDGFASLATATGRRLGLRDTAFKDPAGLDGDEGFGGGTTSSAYDLAIIARNALAVPAIADTAAKVSYEFTDPNGVGRRLVNHNKGLLTGYPGAIGLKTGYTSAASRTLLAAARRDGHTCIASVMGTWDDTGWASYLLDQCFAGVRVAGAAPLPAVRAQTVQDRADAFSGIPHAFGSGARTAAAAVVAAPAAPKPADPTPPTPNAADTLDPGAKDPGAKDPGATKVTATVAAAAATPSSDDGWSLGSIARTAGLVLLGLLVIVVILRRRAVKRQRARRIARMEALAEARRRRMIDVIEPDTDSDIRVLPARTGHHVAASGRRRSSDRRVVRVTRPRDPATGQHDRGRR